LDQFTLITDARQLLTLAAKPGVRRGTAMQDLGVIENGAILIRNSEIIQVGFSRRLENLREARNAIRIDAGGRVVLPALIDPSLFAAIPRNESGNLPAGNRYRRCYLLFASSHAMARLERS
jgi:imidazolonepropionase-like amidohydrolase